MMDYAKVDAASAELFETLMEIDERFSGRIRDGRHILWDDPTEDDEASTYKEMKAAQGRASSTRIVACRRITAKYELSKDEVDAVQKHIIKLLREQP